MYAQLQAVHNFLSDQLQGRSLYLLASLLLLFAIDPLLGGGFEGLATWELLLTLLTLTSIYTLSVQTRHARIAYLLAIPIVATLWISFFVTGSGLGLPVLSMLTVFLFYIVIVVLSRVLSADTVTMDTVAGALTAYLLLGVIWASGYSMIYWAAPSSFSLPTDVPGAADADSPPMHLFLYFSFVTMTTVGYGDIAPVSPLARTLTVLEAILGQFYLAVLVARLVSLQVTEKAKDPK
jgi:hypothetical protein